MLTRQTKEQILAHNEAGAKLCGWTAMSVSVSDGPAIVAGYEYRLQLEADSPVFPAGCALAAQVRAKVSDSTVIATLTTANGGLARISDTVVEITIPRRRDGESPAGQRRHGHGAHRSRAGPASQLHPRDPRHPARHARAVMAGKIELAPHTGPIRIRVSGTEQVRVRVSSVPIAVRVLGMPGPQGQAGAPGSPGPQGPPGSLDTGIVLDGGNF